VDFVFGDLTDIPVDSSGEQDAWDFIKLILNKSMQVIKPGGKYLTHVSTYLYLWRFDADCIAVLDRLIRGTQSLGKKPSLWMVDVRFTCKYLK